MEYFFFSFKNFFYSIKPRIRSRSLFFALFIIGFAISFSAGAASSTDEAKQADIVFSELEQKGELTTKLIHWGATFLLGLSIVVSGVLLAMGRLSWGASLALISGGLLVGAASSIARFLTGFSG
jgi:hypothetical protein